MNNNEENESYGERFVKNAYDLFLRDKETFDDDMKEKIKSEIEKMTNEYKEWAEKNKKS